MAKKRGGLAGLYDRNKGLFRTAAILGGTALGGPAGGAAAGAAFRGLDRPGKRGIGFDVGQGLRGAAEGYTIGKTAVGAKQAIGKMLAPKAAALPSLAAPDSLGVVNTMLPSQATTPLATGGMSAIGNAAVAPDVGSLASRAAGQVAGQSPKLGRVESILSKVEKYPKAFEMMQSSLPDPQAQARIDAEMMRARSDEERARLERERFMLEQRMLAEGGQRQANLLRALMPSLSDILGLNQAPGSPATRTASPFISGAGPMSLDDAVLMSGATVPRPVPLSAGTELGDYLAGQGAFVPRPVPLSQETEMGRYLAREGAFAGRGAGRRAGPATSRRGAGGYSIYDR